METIANSVFDSEEQQHAAIQRLSYAFELQRRDCRYPYGGDSEGEAITFCGHPRQPGSSYCTPHFHLSRDPLAGLERPASIVALKVVEVAAVRAARLRRFAGGEPGREQPSTFRAASGAHRCTAFLPRVSLVARFTISSRS